MCGNCKGNHSPLDRNCPVYQYENAVLKIKTEQNITLTAARKLAETPSTTSYAAVVKNHTDLYNQEKKKQQPKKIAQNEPNPAKEQHQQQATQKRAHHPTEHITPVVHLTVSPPRKRSTPQPSDDESEDDTRHESGKSATISIARKLTSETNSNPSQIPSTSSPNPFQPPYSLRKKSDPRHSNALKK